MESFKKKNLERLHLAQIVGEVISFSLALMSHIIDLPLLSKNDRWSWKVKLLLKRIATPPLEVEYEVNRDLRSYCEDHTGYRD